MAGNDESGAANATAPLFCISSDAPGSAGLMMRSGRTGL